MSGLNRYKLNPLFCALAAIFLSSLVSCESVHFDNQEANSNSLELSGCEAATLTEPSLLSMINNSLPNPFVSVDGKAITNKQQWQCKQRQVAAMAQHYMLGDLPDSPVKVTSQYSDNTLTVDVSNAQRHMSFKAEVILPKTGSAPYPVMIGVGRVFLNTEALSELGIAIINFPNGEIAEQKNGESRGKGKFFDFWGHDHNAGALIAWSWGVSRLIDALQSNPELPLNAQRIGITGCSRNGKGAIVAGAMDSRINLTIPQESGAGGAANWRISDAAYARGENVQTVRQIVTENVWFRDDFRQFSESVTSLPFDQHQVLGLIAPRGLLLIDNQIDWLGVESSYSNGIAARSIWQALGHSNNIGISQTTAHQHCQQPASQQAEINAFVAKFLLDDPAQLAEVSKNENNIHVDQARWMPWPVPNLN